MASAYAQHREYDFNDRYGYQGGTTMEKRMHTRTSNAAMKAVMQGTQGSEDPVFRKRWAALGTQHDLHGAEGLWAPGAKQEEGPQFQSRPGSIFDTAELSTGHKVQRARLQGGGYRYKLSHPDSTFVHHVSTDEQGNVTKHQIEKPRNIRTVKGPSTSTFAVEAKPSPEHNRIYKALGVKKG